LRRDCRRSANAALVRRPAAADSCHGINLSKN
jgi:hypothetical protein